MDERKGKRGNGMKNKRERKGEKEKREKLKHNRRKE